MPDPRFLNQPKHFWANVRTISQQAGYTLRGQGQIKVPSIAESCGVLQSLGLSSDHIADANHEPTPLGQTLFDYFHHRASRLNDFVEPRLMDVTRAKQTFARVKRQCRRARCPIPMNKQKGAKRGPAYFTAIINMLIESNSAGFPCDFDPRVPLRTLARRVDGAFPSTVNPIAVWEIKEYYYTTSFGSRVADGVYESLLDGMELEELREHEGIDVKHYLMIDAHYTWWKCGRSYLCRVFDMLHMGFVDEVLFGYEVIERLPAIVQQWVELAIVTDTSA